MYNSSLKPEGTGKLVYFLWPSSLNSICTGALVQIAAGMYKKDEKDKFRENLGWRGVVLLENLVD